MKRLLTLLLLGTMLVSTLTGCGSKTTLDPDNPVTLTIWHVYGSQTNSPLNDLIDEFNSTTGKDTGVLVKVVMVTDSTKIDDTLSESIANIPGSADLPDLFVAYPRVAEKFDDGVLLDFSDYFTAEELELYREDFLNEGYFGDKLLMLPIGKSSELIFVNNTLFSRFSAASGITTDCFKDVESIMDTANISNQ